MNRALAVVPLVGFRPPRLTRRMTTPTEQDAAIEHFAAKLRFETDPSDAAAALAAGDGTILVDVRGHAAWHQGRVRGAIHLPHAEIADRAAALVPPGVPVVVYCWGPGCNGATRGALEFARLGYPVKEMIGGFEYWAREGLEIVDDSGPITRAVDVLTAPRTSAAAGVSCDC
jgi:rhodanese-related sulfurtransferase